MRTMDLTECAAFLKIERTHALKLAGEGVLPGAKIGRAWVFLEEDLVAYLKAEVKQQQEKRRQALVPDPLAQHIQVKPSAKTARPLAMSPLAITRRTKKVRPNLDLYDLAVAHSQPQPSS